MVFLQKTGEPLLLNNSLQNWTYTHFRNGGWNDYKKTTLVLNTTFSSSDLTKGVFKGLILQSMKNSSSKSTFSISSQIKKQVFLTRNSFFNQIASFIAGTLVLVSVFQVVVTQIKFKSNFGYISARFLLFFHMTYCMAQEGLITSGIITVFGVQFTEIMAMLLFWRFSLNRGTLLRDIKAILRKRAFLVLVTEIVLILFTIYRTFYPMVVFVPFLMAFVDRLQSFGCQHFRILIISEFSKFLIILVGCYVPFYISHLNFNLLMDFNYQNIAIFSSIGFILLPGLFYLRKYLSKRIIKNVDIELAREELHGKDKDRPMMIQEGLGDIIPKRYKFLSKEFPHFYSSKKLPFYNPKSLLGVLEVEVIKILALNQEPMIKPTGFLNIYTYKRKANPMASSLPQQCQELGYKPSIKFRVLNKLQGIGSLNIIPVETPEASDEQRFVAITMNPYGKHGFPIFKSEI